MVRALQFHSNTHSYIYIDMHKKSGYSTDRLNNHFKICPKTPTYTSKTTGIELLSCMEEYTQSKVI